MAEGTSVFDRLKELFTDTPFWSDFVRNYGNSYNPTTPDPPDIARMKAAFIAGWYAVHNEPPPTATMRALEQASTKDETNAVIRESLIDNPLGGQVAAASVAATEGEIRASTDTEVLSGWGQEMRDGKPVYVQAGTGKIMTPEEMRASQSSEDQRSELEQMLEDTVPAGPKPEPQRELPYIGGYPGADTLTQEQIEGGAAIYTPPGGPPDSQRLRDSSLMGSEFYDPAAKYNKPETKLRYNFGDNWGPASWDAVQVVALKEQLVRAGYLREEYATQGSAWSSAEADAMMVLMDEANGIGHPWDVQLAIISNNPSEVAQRKQTAPARIRDPFVAPSYLAPDMDLLKQAVKESVRAKLGREPSSREMSQLISGLDSDYRAAYDVQVQASRSEYDATTAAIESGVSQSGGEFRSVDPGSSFAEVFEQRFGNELDFKKRREALNVRESYGDATMRMIDSMVGGG